MCFIVQVCVYTGSLLSDSDSDRTNAECKPCDGGCQCRQGTMRGPDGTCDPVSGLLIPVACFLTSPQPKKALESSQLSGSDDMHHYL